MSISVESYCSPSLGSGVRISNASISGRYLVAVRFRRSGAPAYREELILNSSTVLEIPLGNQQYQVEILKLPDVFIGLFFGRNSSNAFFLEARTAEEFQMLIQMQNQGTGFLSFDTGFIADTRALFGVNIELNGNLFQISVVSHSNAIPLSEVYNFLALTEAELVYRQNLDINCSLQGISVQSTLSPAFQVPIANGLRFIELQADECCIGKNPDKTLFATYFNPLFGYRQKVRPCDKSVLQVLSNFRKNKLAIYAFDGFLLEEIQIVQEQFVEQVQQFAATMPARSNRLREQGTQEPRDIVGFVVQIRRSGQTGFFRRVIGAQVNESGNFVEYILEEDLLVDFSDGNVQVSYTFFPNHSLFYQFELDWAAFPPAKCYYLELRGEELPGERIDVIGGLPTALATVQPVSRSFLSEPIDLGKHEKSIKIEYTNQTNDYGINYQFFNSAGTKHFIRIKAEFAWTENFEKEVEVYRKANGQRKKLYSAVSRKRLLRTDRLPNYMHEKIVLALEHDLLLIDGQAYVSEEDYQKTDINRQGYSSGSVSLTDNEFYEENQP